MSAYIEFLKKQEKSKYNRSTYIIVVLALASIVFMLTGCSQWVPLATQDPELKPYFTHFENTFGVYPWHVSAKFEDKNKDPKVMGGCGFRGATLQITIYRNHWSKLGKYGKEQLMFHEFGHCVFSRKHTPLPMFPMMPTSIMNEYFIMESYYEAHRIDYINELRSK